MGQGICLDGVSVRVGSAVVACSAVRTASYLQHEIFSEGVLSSDVPWWTVLPISESGTQSPEWVQRQLDVIDDFRRVVDNPFPINVNDQNLDVGLVDIQVYMDVDEPTAVTRLLKSQSSALLHHNEVHLDLLAKGAIHDQMVLLQTLHFLEPTGRLRLHFHNVILGLRREGSAIGFLDVAPLLTTLASGAKIAFIL